jgi:hypothetical protein
LCAWCGKDFERREVAAAFAAPRPAVVIQRTEQPALAPPTQIPAPQVAAATSTPPAATNGRGPTRKGIRAAAARKASDPLPER